VKGEKETPRKEKIFLDSPQLIAFRISALASSAEKERAMGEREREREKNPHSLETDKGLKKA